MKKFSGKRVLAALLAMLMAMSLFTVCGFGDEVTIPTLGNINADDGINAADALLALQHSVKLITLTKEEFEVADVDGNDLVDATDALYILQYSVKLIDRFPAEENQSTPPTGTPIDSEVYFDPDPGPGMKPDLENLIRVTDAPYNAAGDGETNDRAAIQAAIDDAYEAGGGTVCLTADKTFLTANLYLRSNVILYFEDGAKLKQTEDPTAFVYSPSVGVYESFEVTYGHAIYSDILWDVGAFYNYPFLYAHDSENITITGNGIIELSRGNGCDDTIHMQVVGFYKVKHYEISSVTIQKYNAYCMKMVNCSNGLYKDLTIKDATDSATDGIALVNCQNIRVTGCDLTTGDDGMYVCSNWNDPREGLWYDNKTPQPSKNIEFDNNHCEVTWDATKAFAFIMWGGQFPDQQQVEVSNIYVHDNYFETMGAWTGNWSLSGNEFEFNGSTNAMKNIRFENNEIGTIQDNFYTLPVSDFYGFDSMGSMKNGDFESEGSLYWLSRAGGTAGTSDEEAGQDGTYCGYIADLDKADSALYQGLKFIKGYTYEFTAKVQSSGDTVRFFVKDQITQELIASKEFSNTEWQEINLSFEVPETGNYHIGIERGNATGGWARVDSIVGTIDIDIPEGETILTTQTPTETKSGMQNMLGIAFSPKVNGTVTHVRFYSSANESGTHLVGLWDVETGYLLTEEIYEWTTISGYEGWQYFELPTPINLEAGRTYIAAVSSSGDTCFSWAGNQLASPIESDNLITYANSGRWRDITTYSVDMPTSESGSNYFRDVVFVAGDAVEPEPVGPDAFERTSLSIDEAVVTTYGRTYSANDALYFNWTMSGFSFEVDGTDAYATFDITKSKNRNVYVNVYVDGDTDPYNTLCLSESGEYLLARGLSEGTHTIKVLKRSEAATGTVAVSAITSSGSFTDNAPSKSTRTIEVLGDSITAGFGNMVTNGGSATHTSYEQDGTRTYATMAAERFGADLTTISYSGIGCIYVGNGPDYVMQDIYPYVDGVNLDTTTQYDFHSNPSDVVVISLGTNDCGWPSDSELVAAAEEMITMVRQKNPDSIIIWCYGMMTDHRSNLFEQAVDNIVAAGDSKVYYLALPLADAATEGTGVGGHPTLASHLTASEVLTDFIATVTGWDTVTDTPANSEFIGKSALFVGDSISYGSTDTPSNRAWATRIGDSTGVLVDNRSQIGSSVSTACTSQIVQQLEGVKNNTYDYVIMQGGVNDADAGAPVGTVTESLNPADFDCSTFAGALENLFYTAKQYFPDAALGYIINYQLPLLSTSDMGIYYDVAVAVCEKWDVSYLDLYKNDDITNKLIRPDLVGERYNMEDSLHLNHNGYDALTPSIKSWFKTLVSDSGTEPEPVVPTSETILNDLTPAGTQAAFMMLGVNFSTKVDGTITHVRMYNSGSESGVHQVAVWETATGALLTDGALSWEVTSETGWQTFKLPTPIAVKAGTEYTVGISVCGENGSVYSRTGDYYTATTENGNLITYAGSGRYAALDGNNPDYTAMPTGSATSNYFRDVVFVAGGTVEPETDPAVDAVIAAIDALPAADAVALTDADAVTAARTAYDALTDDQKALVAAEKVTKLTNLEAKLKELDTETPTSETIHGDTIPDGTQAAFMMLGTYFSTKVDGTITHVRMYSSGNENGVHHVALWNADTGELLTDGALEWTVSTDVGWMEFELPTPIAVKAGTKYIVGVSSVGSNGAIYSRTGNYFTAETEIGNLITYANSGRYVQLPNSNVDYTVMPTGTGASSYFRDIVFVAGGTTESEPEPETPTSETILTTQTPTETKAGFNMLGVNFSTKVDGTITHVRIYTSGNESGVHKVGLWETATGTLLTDGALDWEVTSEAGWQTFELPTPIAVKAGTEYTVAVSVCGLNGSLFAWAANQFTATTENGNLITYTNSGRYAGLDGNNPDYTAMPTSTTSSNYFRDIVFVAAS